ncbi:DUF4625 domain-containing protein [Kineosporia babensis]|uniref:DUF4625 domain-containing protein n=1 Tax=Kineosporia babensis TaxID=499548 RepID=A0A9X1NMB0_9ACTN|nr:DUF4625 domain-containing protein [Kineosporia babensis]MCD5316748.1 DUF4625 domain-containing protein [Kineosporia babensis]
MIRRVLITGTVTVATLLGPAAVMALAAPVPTLSVQKVRPGTSFTLTPPTPCPSAMGEQVVYITYTDSEETTHQLAALSTDSSGGWGATSLRLPVAGLDSSGEWDDPAVAAGPGTVDVSCLDADYVAAGTAPGFSSRMPGQVSQAIIDPPVRQLDEPEDDDPPSDDDGNVTQTYEPVSLAAAGTPAQVSVSRSIAEPGAAISVAPVDVCDASAAQPTSARIQISPTMPVDDSGDSGSDDSDDSGNSDNSGDPDDDGSEELEGLGAEADPEAIVTVPLELTAGTWQRTKITIPEDAPLGDYAVAVDCLDSSMNITSSYAGSPLALGTATAAAPVCSTKGATVRLTGSYPEAVLNDEDELTLPATLRLNGSGPWSFTLESALTGAQLLKQKVSCPQPDYELTVPKTALTSAGVVRARVCNTGDADARALLQVALKGKKFATVDRQLLKDGDCTWLDGGKVKKGSSAKARVVIDPAGKGTTDQEVEHSFKVRRKG